MHLREDYFWPLLILASAISLVSLMTFEIATLEPWLKLWFLLFCCGMTVVQFLNLNSLTAKLTLAIALSLAINSTIAVIMVYSKLWSPSASLTLLIWLSISFCLLKLLQTYYRYR